VVPRKIAKGLQGYMHANAGDHRRIAAELGEGVLSMTNITIHYAEGKFLLSVDGKDQDIEGEDDLLTKLMELGCTRARAMNDIARVKVTQADLRIK
jgi:hypothetical protein